MQLANFLVSRQDGRYSADSADGRCCICTLHGGATGSFTDQRGIELSGVVCQVIKSQVASILEGWEEG